MTKRPGGGKPSVPPDRFPPDLLPLNRTWTPSEVAEFLGVPVATLHQWRYLGTGPKAAKVGRHLRYLPSDVLAWFRQQQERAA